MELRKDFKQTDIGLIPRDWEVMQLGEIGKFKNGINKNKDEFGFGYPFVNLMDVFGKSIVIPDSISGLVNSSKTDRELYDLRKGDVLFVRSSVKPNGVGLTSVVHTNLENTVFSGFLIRFRDNDYFDLRFKIYCFYEEKFRKRLIANSTVSANTNINQEALKKLYVVFPPNKKEQKAIAQALSDVDELINSLEKLIAKKRNIKQGTMQQLLTGKKRLPGFSGEWETKKIGEIAVIKKGQLITEKTCIPGNIPVIAGGKEPAYYHNVANRHSETITISASGANAGYISYHITPIFASDCSTIEEDQNYSLQFIYYSLQIMQEKIYKMQTGGAQPHIHPRDIGPIEISIPSIEEQQKIALIISDLDKEISIIESERTKYKSIKQGMMQELLTGKTRLVDESKSSIQ